MFTSHWAAKYIKFAVDDSIISGYGINKIKPEQYNISELHRMIVSSLDIIFMQNNRWLPERLYYLFKCL